MTNEELQAIRDRAQAATPGAWEPGHADYMRVEVYQAADAPKVNPLRWQRACICREAREWDAGFIAHARTDIAALLDEVDRLREILAESIKVSDRWITWAMQEHYTENIGIVRLTEQTTTSLGMTP